MRKFNIKSIIERRMRQNDLRSVGVYLRGLGCYVGAIASVIGAMAALHRSTRY